MQKMTDYTTELNNLNIKLSFYCNFFIKQKLKYRTQKLNKEWTSTASESELENSVYKHTLAS